MTKPLPPSGWPPVEVDIDGVVYEMDLYAVMYALGSGGIPDGDERRLLAAIVAEGVNAQDPTETAAALRTAGHDPLAAAEPITPDSLIAALGELVEHGWVGPHGPQMPDGTRIGPPPRRQQQRRRR